MLHLVLCTQEKTMSHSVLLVAILRAWRRYAVDFDFLRVSEHDSNDGMNRPVVPANDRWSADLADPGILWSSHLLMVSRIR